MILFCVLCLDVVWGGALCSGCVMDYLFGFGGLLWFVVVLWIIALVLGGALCFGLYLGFRHGIWEVLCVLWF